MSDPLTDAATAGVTAEQLVHLYLSGMASGFQTALAHIGCPVELAMREAKRVAAAAYLDPLARNAIADGIAAVLAAAGHEGALRVTVNVPGTCDEHKEDGR